MGGVNKYPFQEMAEGESVLIPWGAEGKVRTAGLLSGTKNNYKAKGIILDITEDAAKQGFVVKVLARDKPPKPKIIRRQAESTPKRAKGSTEGIRRRFWRDAFLKAMDNLPVAQLAACSITATEALRLYDEWLIEEAAPVLSAAETIIGKNGH